MDAESLEFADGTFDVVLCNLSLFLFDTEQSLRECRRVLKPDGRLGFTDFGRGDPRWHWHRDLLWSLRDDEPVSQAKRPEPERDQGAEIELRLASLGFDSIVFSEESHDLVFADADEWWQWVWSQGQRRFLERLDERRLERHRADVYARPPDPIVNTWTALVVLARRSWRSVGEWTRYALWRAPVSQPTSTTVLDGCSRLEVRSPMTAKERPLTSPGRPRRRG